MINDQVDFSMYMKAFDILRMHLWYEMTGMSINWSSDY